MLLARADGWPARLRRPPAPQAAVGGVAVELACGAAPPLKVSPAAEWDASRCVLRWRVQGLPPSGRALLRAAFAPGQFPVPVGGAPTLVVAVLMPFSLAAAAEGGAMAGGA